jgi:hypothetical protein
MSDQPKTIYLSKDGKVTGPFAETEINEMRESGDLQQYSWIWHGAGKNWEPLSAPPPPPANPSSGQSFPTPPSASSSGAGASASRTTKGAPPVQRRATGNTGGTPRPVPSNPIQAVCHDNRNVVSGVISQIKADGFSLMSADHSTTMPPFRKGGHVALNLLDDAAGKTENIKATIIDFERKGHFWEYELKWETKPKVLLKS